MYVTQMYYEYMDDIHVPVMNSGNTSTDMSAAPLVRLQAILSENKMWTLHCSSPEWTRFFTPHMQHTHNLSLWTLYTLPVEASHDTNHYTSSASLTFHSPCCNIPLFAQPVPVTLLNMLSVEQLQTHHCSSDFIFSHLKMICFNWIKWLGLPLEHALVLTFRQFYK